MALQASDIIVVQRPATKVLYHCKVEDFTVDTPIPDGDNENYMLIWNGDSWVAGTLDGGYMKEAILIQSMAAHIILK